MHSNAVELMTVHGQLSGSAGSYHLTDNSGKTSQLHDDSTNPDHLFVDHFFFSSRRRHTRSTRDWSSDVCSSDLSTGPAATSPLPTCAASPTCGATRRS